MRISAAPHELQRAWVSTVGVALVAVAGLAVLFWQEALGAYRVWVGSTAYNHCFLILPLVGYMIWERRATLLSAVPTPQFGALAVIPILSAMWLVAAVLGIHEAQQFIALTILQTVFLSMLGWDTYKRLLAPLLYLYFLVPTGAVLVPFLQDFTASMVVSGLHLVGVPVYSDGILIEVPAGKFAIAEECAGLRFLIASVALGVFFAIIMYKSWARRVAFIALSVVVPIFANGLRAFGIVYAAQLIGNAAAVTADHVIYGWGFFSAILILLMLVGRTFTDRRAGSAEQSEVSMGRFAPARSAMVGLLSVVLASLGPAYAAVLDRQSAAEVATHARAPRVGAPWRPAASGVPDWTPVVHGADQTFLDAFSDGDVRIYRFVALYVAHGRVNDLIRSENRVADEPRWQIATGTTATMNVSGHEERINVSEIVSGERRRLVMSFYALDGVVASDVLSTKLYQLRGLLVAGPQLSSFVAIAVDIPDRTAPPLAAAARFLSAMEPLPDYLRTLSQQ